MTTVDSREFLYDGLEDSPLTIALAHGAGAGMDSNFMNLVAAGLGANGYRVVRFEFPYMESIRKTARRRAPDPLPVLLRCFEDVVSSIGTPEGLVIGGKSMGGRVATMVADRCQVAGVVCFGYPFQPPGGKSRPRIEHLQSIATPSLIIQGTRDAFGPRETVEHYDLSDNVRIAWIEDGDHSLKPRASSGRTFSQALAEAVAVATEFLNELSRARAG